MSSSWRRVRSELGGHADERGRRLAERGPRRDGGVEVALQQLGGRDLHLPAGRGLKQGDDRAPARLEVGRGGFSELIGPTIGDQPSRGSFCSDASATWLTDTNVAIWPASPEAVVACSPRSAPAPGTEPG